MAAADVLLEWFAAHARGDLEAARRLLLPSAPIQVGEQALRGFDELLSWYDGRRAAMPGLRYDVLDVLGGETHAAAVIRISVEDRTWRQVALYEIRAGRIAAITAFEDAPPP